MYHYFSELNGIYYARKCGTICIGLEYQLNYGVEVYHMDVFLLELGQITDNIIDINTFKKK